MTPRTFIIQGQEQVDLLLALLPNLPMDGSVECIIRLHTKARTVSQNARQWADILAQISAQAFVKGKQYTPEVWHEHFKQTLLPDAPDALLTRPGYIKWQDMPDGALKCVGSTTKLTKRGFSEYTTAVEAYACTELGVQFLAAPR